MIVEILKKDGPCLSSKLAAKLTEAYGITPEAARKRVSRLSVPGVKKLKHLPFPKRASFIYLQQQYASNKYWNYLYDAIWESKGAYAKALGVVIEHQVMTVNGFKVSCGAPVAQKKHISADIVLERMVAAGVLVKLDIQGIGDCVLLKQTSESLHDDLIARNKSRLAAESVLIDSVREWLRRLAFASFDSVKVRSDGEKLPMVGTFCWDITAPSYMAGLVSWKGGDIVPGFVVCDVFLGERVSLMSAEAFLYKVSATKSLRNVSNVMFMFVANSYESEAFSALRSAGVVPATVSSLFGKDVSSGFICLMDTLSDAVGGSVNLDGFNNIFKTLGKLEGAMGNMRGTFFEYLVAELIRKHSPASIELNKRINTSIGKAEIDVWVLKEGVVAQFVECKGKAPEKQIDDEQIDLWLDERIPRIRKHLENKVDLRGVMPCFQLWTTGEVSHKSLVRIGKVSKANKRKYRLEVVDANIILSKLQKCNDRSLVEAFSYFLPNPKKKKG